MEPSCPCLLGSAPLPASSDVGGLEACPVSLEVVNFLPEAWLLCPRVHMLVRARTHTHADMHTHTDMHTHRDLHAHTEAGMHAHTYTDMHTHSYHMQTCTHTLQVHTLSLSPAPLLLVGKGKVETLGP